MITQQVYFQIVQTALEVGEVRYGRDAVLNWLAAYPGDLQAGLLYARTLIQEGRLGRASLILNNLCETDPEYLPAWQTLAEVHQAFTGNGFASGSTASSTGTSKGVASFSGITNANQASIYNHLAALGGANGDSEGVITWGATAFQVRQELKNGDLDNARLACEELLLWDTPAALGALTHILTLESQPGLRLNDRIEWLEKYHARWPNSLPFSLRLADFWLRLDPATDKESQAIQLLNQAVARDTNGQTALRLWGEGHPYRTLWPETLKLELESTIPAPVIQRLGWNRLPEGEKPLPPESEGSINPAVVGGLALGLGSDLAAANPLTESVVAANAVANVDESTAEEGRDSAKGTVSSANNRIPNYILFTVKEPLVKKFGEEGWKAVQTELELLSQANCRLDGWKARIFLADDPTSAGIEGLQPGKELNAWGLKLALVDLDRALEITGERIGAVLIVGGPDIVPFHRLPNPVNDPDQEIFSDNPYASLDDNYFIPEWAVGRLPDGARVREGETSDPAYLLAILRQTVQRGIACQNQKGGRKSWGSWFRFYTNGKNDNFGYAAAVWGGVSATVFKPIGKKKGLFESPPHGYTAPPDRTTQSPKGLRKVISSLNYRLNRKRAGMLTPPQVHGPMAYFNLHGLPDTPEWYGQRDPLSQFSGIDYPVALRAQDIPLAQGKTANSQPKVVYSEACYGSYIQGKEADDSMALKFLLAGCPAVVGSTCMAYGSVSTPLIAADLLGHSFWIFLNENLPAGEALQRAKIHLAQTMHSRQGYLDGEDQKTLISFILYGDPLSTPVPASGNVLGIKPPWRPPETMKEVKTLSDVSTFNELPPQAVAHVKKVVARYLPGMADAKMAFHMDEISRFGKPLEGKALVASEDGLRRFTLSKQVTGGKSIHFQVAHLTMTAKGKLVKLAVSR